MIDLLYGLAVLGAIALGLLAVRYAIGSASEDLLGLLTRELSAFIRRDWTVGGINALGFFVIFATGILTVVFNTTKYFLNFVLQFLLPEQAVTLRSAISIDIVFYIVVGWSVLSLIATWMNENGF